MLLLLLEMAGLDLLKDIFHLKLISLAESPKKKLKSKIQTLLTTFLKNKSPADLEITEDKEDKADLEDKEAIINKERDLEETMITIEKENLEDKAATEETMMIEETTETIDQEEKKETEDQEDNKVIEDQEKKKEVINQELNGLRLVLSNPDKII